MKKLLLTTAVAGLAFAAAPAHAEVKLEVGGYFSAYGAFVDQDENNGQANSTDIVKNTELHFTGETTLDNGLTVGAHIEFDVDGNEDGVNGTSSEENYAYFSGSWGRVNVGEEDGAAYLLQVAAPSALSGYDGVRNLIDGVNETVLTDTGFSGTVPTNVDYDHSVSGYNTKVTYLSPVVNGFQAGVSYTPDSSDAGDRSVRGSDTAGNFGETYEIGARYEGEYEGVGVTLGAGYSLTDLAAVKGTTAGSLTDERAAWNVGLDLDFGPFGVGVAYQEDDHGEEVNALANGKIDDEEIFVAGVDYTTGPFKLGASYYDAENVEGEEDLDAKRYAGGVVYTYGPGMTLSGTVSYIEYDAQNIAGTNQNDADATQFLVGTKFKF